MEAEDSISNDLRNRLHAMEAKLKRMREQRNGHSAAARRAADSRNSVQQQGSELRDGIKARMDEQKAVSSKAKVHQSRRAEIQQNRRELISR